MAPIRGKVLRLLAGLLAALGLAACGGGGDDPAWPDAPPSVMRADAGAGLVRVPLQNLDVQGALLPSFDAAGTVDGDTATPAWHIDGLRSSLSQYGVLQGPSVTVDLGWLRELAVVRIGIHAAQTPPSTLYYVTWSDDGTTWQYADNAGLLVTAAGWNTLDLGAGTGAHRYWRVQLRETAADTGPWMTDLALWTDGTPAYVEHLHPAASASRFALPAWFPENLCDHNPDSGAWHTDGAPAGAWVAVDFGTPRDLRQVRVRLFVDQSPPFATQYDVQWSDDGVAWSRVAILAPAKPGWTTAAWGPAGAHRHWRLLLTFATPQAPWVGEWQWMGPAGTRLDNAWPLAPGSPTQFAVSGWLPDGVADGDTGTYGWHTDTATGNAFVEFDLGTPRAVERLALFRVVDTSGLLQARYQLGGSNNGIGFEVGIAPIVVSDAPGWTVAALTSPRTYRYWRLYLLNTPGPGAWISEARLLPPDY